MRCSIEIIPKSKENLHKFHLSFCKRETNNINGICSGKFVKFISPLLISSVFRCNEKV